MVIAATSMPIAIPIAPIERYSLLSGLGWLQRLQIKPGKILANPDNLCKVTSSTFRAGATQGSSMTVATGAIARFVGGTNGNTINGGTTADESLRQSG